MALHELEIMAKDSSKRLVGGQLKNGFGETRCLIYILIILMMDLKLEMWIAHIQKGVNTCVGMKQIGC